jgi:hypothetical protein
MAALLLRDLRKKLRNSGPDFFAGYGLFDIAGNVKVENDDG